MKYVITYMRRIWFTQQQKLNCNYLPLRWGLGQYSDEAIDDFARIFKNDAPDNPKKLYCPKLYTTRTHCLSGEYIVVEGSRFKAKPVEPRIEFRVTSTCRLNLAEGLVCPIHNGKPDYENWAAVEILNKNNLTFAELDLGIKGAAYGHLRDELLRLNPKATIDTPFYVNLLEAL